MTSKRMKLAIALAVQSHIRQNAQAIIRESGFMAIKDVTVVPITELETQVQVTQEGRGVRFFSVRVSENA